MVDFWGSVKSTAESLGGAAYAPVGAVVDLAQMPFDDKDDDFGSLVETFSRRSADALDPIVNPNTMTGSAIGHALEAMNWAYINGVSEPVATGTMVGRHTFGDWQVAGPVGMAAAIATGRSNLGDLFDSDTWAEAYERANQQDGALGAAFASGALDLGTDPLSVDNPYAKVSEEHPHLAPALGLTGEVAGSFAADPAFLGLKAAGLARQVVQYRGLSSAEKANFYTDVATGAKSGSIKSSLQSRTDKYLDWVGGKNSVNRPLSAPEIFYGTPELQRYAKDPEAVAGFLADAQKIEDPIARRDVQRRVMAVAAGDLTQVSRLRAENAEAASIADQLSNMARGAVIDLDALGVAPNLANNPIFRLRLENQLTNMNKSGDVDKFIDDFIGYNDRLLETQKTMPNVPGVHNQGKRAVNRMNDQGLARLPKNTLDDWSARLAQKAESTSSVVQKGKYTVPLVAVRTVGLMASPWTKAPVAVSDALRQTHFQGVASLHDWGSATNQIDSMMRLGEVPHGDRMMLLSKAFLAKTESEKQVIIEQAEKASVKGLMNWAGTRTGQAVDEDYIATLMERGAAKRQDAMTSLKGRVYATTEAPEEMATRMGGATEDAAALAESGGWSAKTGGKWRLDQINDDGTPLALPVFETQLGNYVPMFDVARARTLVKRDTGHLSRLSRAWREESREIERLSGLKAAGATGLDKTIAAKAAARDWLEDAGSLALRGWKFSVLFRLGYPMRVLTDDHLRIWSKIGAGSFYGPNLKEFGGNVKFNTFDRKAAARASMRDLRVERQQILDELDGNEMMVHSARADDLKSIESSLRGHQRSVTRLRKEIEDAETRRSLGIREPSTGPDGVRSVSGGELKAGMTRVEPGDNVVWMNPQTLVHYAAHRAGLDGQEVDAARAIENSDLIASMRKNGFDPDYAPLVSVDTVNGRVHIKDGNHRTNFAADAGEERIPVVVRTTGENKKRATGPGMPNRGEFDTAEPFVLAPNRARPGSLSALRAKLKDAEAKVADKEAAQAHLNEQLGAYGPQELKRRLDEIQEQIDLGTKAAREPKRKVGSADVDLGDGVSIPGAYAGEYGDVMRAASASGHSFESLLTGAESRSYRSVSGGSHSTIQPEAAGHLDAWADVLNNQLATSPVAKFFLEGGDVAGFTKWIKEPEQAQLRRRVAHFAYDPEDWGTRAQGIVHDYVPTDEVRQALLSGRVTPAQLRKMTDIQHRPSVHGRAAADNLGHSTAVQAVSNTMNRMFRALGETPTDVLSRHPYFNSLYKMHAQDFYAVRKASGVTKFTPDDAAEIAHMSRKAALKDLKATLFDMSAHSHAAHVMRFISPFFGAHQEGVARWWRIAADKPQIVRRFTQAMDVPRMLQIEVDENGDLVKPGAPISSDHRILLQLPRAFGGPDPTRFQSKWSINENAFNIILQGGLTNPGSGPLVTIPFDWAAETYADDPAIARVARIFNPYPANNPLENAFPALGKRLAAYMYGKTGVDPSLGLGIGKREYNAAFAQNVQDKMVDFQLKYGREPDSSEADKLMEEAGAESTTQMLHRALWNGLSPAPASPRSKYAIYQQGWFKIQEQAKSEGKDFDWAYAQFKDKYGAAYMPLVFSTSNNPGWVDANPASVGAIKHYKSVLKNVDPALTRMVIGPYADEMIEKNATLGEYSPDSRNFLRNEQIKAGSDETYYSYDEPRTAMDEQMVRRGWQQYGDLQRSLNLIAQSQGLESLDDSPALVEAKRKGVQMLRDGNYAFDQDYGVVDSTKYDRYLGDMQKIADAPVLAGDVARPDIKVLQTYLKVRGIFTKIIAARQAAGLGGIEAQASEPIKAAFTQVVNQLVESNTYFEEHDYAGIIERDPLLLREAS